jgi:hypothetical protein
MSAEAARPAQHNNTDIRDATHVFNNPPPHTHTVHAAHLSPIEESETAQRTSAAAQS